MSTLLQKIFSYLKNNKLMTLIVVFVIVFIIGVNRNYLVNQSIFLDREQENQDIYIELTHDTLQNVGLTIPVKYLGPRFLELSKKNFRGGEQRKVLVQFNYPSMEPIDEAQTNVNNSQEFLYASINNSIQFSMRGFIRRKTDTPSSHYKLNGEVCGLKIYEELPDVYIGHTLYHYFDDKNPTNDIHLDCSKRKCRLYIVFPTKTMQGNYFSVQVNGIPKADICKWEDTSQNVVNLISSFNQPNIE